MISPYEKLSILLVDAEQFIRELVARLLREMGVKTVIMAGDGDVAIKKLSAAGGRIDLMILDLEMPKMNGFQVVQKVRQGDNDLKKDMPIIILTGHGQEDAVKKAVNLGVHGFMVKPMSRDVLEKRITQAMSSGPINPKILE